jgi:hypothetical protein
VSDVWTAVWIVAGWAVVFVVVYGPRRREQGPVEYGPLPVPLVAPLVRYADAELLAVDAVLWSYAEAVGACDG